LQICAYFFSSFSSCRVISNFATFYKMKIAKYIGRPMLPPCDRIWLQVYPDSMRVFQLIWSYCAASLTLTSWPLIAIFWKLQNISETQAATWCQNLAADLYWLKNHSHSGTLVLRHFNMLEAPSLASKFIVS
jgi:hypothetical protein